MNTVLKTFPSKIRKISGHSNSIYISQVWNVLECNKRRSMWTNRFVSRFAFVNRRHPSEPVHLVIWVHVVVSVRVFCVCVCVYWFHLLPNTKRNTVAFQCTIPENILCNYSMYLRKRIDIRKNMVGYLVFLA